MAKKAKKTSSKGTKIAKNTKTAKAVALRRTVAKKVAPVKKASKKARKPASQKTPSGKFVYLFGKKTDGNGTMKPLLGGKGANLAEMTNMGLPIPPGFTITTEACLTFLAQGGAPPGAVRWPTRRSRRCRCS